MLQQLHERTKEHPLMSPEGGGNLKQSEVIKHGLGEVSQMFQSGLPASMRVRALVFDSSRSWFCVSNKSELTKRERGLRSKTKP